MWKVKAGAHWAITQPVFDVNCFKKFIKEIEQRDIKIPIIAGIWPLVSYKNALFLHNEVPGISIPAHIMEAMKNSEGKETPSEVGVQLAKEMMEEIKDLVSGFQISAPFGKIDLIEPLLEFSLKENFFSEGKKAECLCS
jgi:homocysteine S-methyltransferase